MSEKNDIEFVKGLYVKPPTSNQPEFVKVRLSIKRKELGNWLRGKTEDWININILQQKSGDGWYAVVNNWKPESKDNKPNGPDAPNDFDDDEIPF